jgi:hypothetical protein
VSQYFTVEIGVMDYERPITMKTCEDVYIFFIVGGRHYCIIYTL